MRIDTKEYLDFSDVLIKPKRSSLSSRKDVELERKFTFLHSEKTWSGIPIMASNMDTIGTWQMRNVLSAFHIPTMIHKFYSSSDWLYSMTKEDDLTQKPSVYLNDFLNKVKYTIPSFGIRKEDIDKFFELAREVEYFPNMICFDVANGYTERFVDHIKRMRDYFGKTITIIAGNVATPEVVEALIFAGADIVKVGIGSGKQCSTRLKAGVGIPQLTSISDCSDAAHGLGGHIIADGGIQQVADVGKAFGAGADFVMIGTLLAGHQESGGDLLQKEFLTNEYSPEFRSLGFNDFTSTKELKTERKQYKEVYGMSSEFAMDKYYGGKANYRSSEGEYSLVEYRGPVKNTIEDILGGLRSTMTYIGARRLKDISKCTTFVKVNRIK